MDTKSITQLYDDAAAARMRLFQAHEHLLVSEQALEYKRAKTLAETDPKTMGSNEAQREAKLYMILYDLMLEVHANEETERAAKHEVDLTNLVLQREKMLLDYLSQFKDIEKPAPHQVHTLHNAQTHGDDLNWMAKLPEGLKLASNGTIDTFDALIEELGYKPDAPLKGAELTPDDENWLASITG